MRFGRNESPVLLAKVRAPSYLLQVMFTNRIGQPTVVEWLAIDSLCTEGDPYMRVVGVLVPVAEDQS